MSSIEPEANDEELKALRLRVVELERQLELAQGQRKWKLELAAKVHRSLLPKPVRHERICVDARYLPIEDVGGDYCQVRFSDRATCYITMCDVMGHGVGPALLATRISSEVRYGILYRREPSDIVRSLDGFLREHFSETELYLSFVAARIDVENRMLTWSGAGHPSLLLLRAGQDKAEELHSQNPLIGLGVDASKGFRQESVSLLPRDRLLLYTDGITETANAAEQQLGVNGLARIALAAKSLGLFDVADFVLHEVTRYQHGATTDDKTLIVAEVA